jgi:hypothetical protein
LQRTLMSFPTASAAVPARVERSRVRVIFAGLKAVILFLIGSARCGQPNVAAVVDDLPRLARELAGDRP